MKRVHVCLVSKEPIPNLVPLRCPGLEPDEVILLVTAEMSAQARRLERVMQRWGVCDVVSVPVSAYDPSAVSAVCTTLIGDHANDQLLLNATGGTKIMALTAFKTFARQGCEAFYLDSANRTIRSLTREGTLYTPADVIDVADYLAAYGQEIISEQKPGENTEAYRQVTSRFLADVEYFVDAIAIVNRYVSPLRNRTKFPVDATMDKRSHSRAFRELVQMFQKHGICKEKETSLSFGSAEAVRFVSGDWLSFYVYETVQGMNPRDVRMEVTVQWDQQGSKPPTNNYDVLFTMHNRLFLIECKTKYFKDEQTAPFTAETIYKLDSLRDAAGGLFGKGMLVSYRSLPDEMKSRLRAIGLEYCDGVGITKLELGIKRMMNG